MSTTYQVVKKDVLKEAVNTQLAQVAPNDEIVIVGARKIKDGRLELEFAQSRQLRNSKQSVLSIINEGDARFDFSNKQIVRVWHMVTLDGAEKAFGMSFADIDKAATGIKDDERVAVMFVIEKFFADGKEFQLNLRVRETIEVAKLPKSMREDIAANNEYADNHKLKSPTGPNKALEPVVDENGNFVYRWNELDYIAPGESIDDQLVEGKRPLSRFNEENLNPANSEVKKVKMAL